MFNLDQAIGKWRQQMQAAGMKTPAALDELENHLREDIGHLMAAGQPEAAAFQVAKKRVGNPVKVAAEFGKAGLAWKPPVIFSSLAWVAVTAGLLIVLLNHTYQGKWSLLLAAHIFSLSLGYVTVFFAGSLAIYSVFQRRCNPGTAGEWKNHLTVSFFTYAAAGLGLAGLILGMFWSDKERGYLFSPGPREVGTLCAVIWLGLASLIGRLGSKSSLFMDGLLTLRLAIVGNMVVALAWFGSQAMVHGSGIGSCWPLNVVLGLHLFCLGVSMVPAHGSGPKAVKT
jgi:hypothetical protein